MEKLYYENSYTKWFSARVTSCVEGKKSLYEVTLDQTAFYPEGGGQPFDMGTLGEAHVLEVHEKKGEVIHYADKPLNVGDEVEGVVDWDRRYSHMQQHSGEHLLSGLVHRQFGYDNVGFHMGQDEVTVDFNGPLTMEEATKLEQEANRLIYANLPVTASYPTAEELKSMDYRSKKELTGQIRIVEIPGGDLCACCGTHVRFTGEIGIVKVVSLTNYKGGVRMGILCGFRALMDYDKKQRQVLTISNQLSAKPDCIEQAVEKLKAKNHETEDKLHLLYQTLFQLKSDHMPDSKEPLLIMEENLTPVLLRQFCTLLYERGKGRIVLVCSEEQGTWKYALGSALEDVRFVSKKLNSQLNGKGGGSSLMVQGTFQAAKEDIERVWKQAAELT